MHKEISLVKAQPISASELFLSNPFPPTCLTVNFTALNIYKILQFQTHFVKLQPN